MKYKQMKDREIKYYAYWPNGNKKSNIYKVAAIDFFNNMVWIRVGRKEVRLKVKEIKLLQVLGEKKTYGSDIYEGCIVETTKEDGTKEYDAVKWDKRFNDYGFATIGFPDIAQTYIDFGHKPKFKVVGNIFENADLLEVK